MGSAGAELPLQHISKAGRARKKGRGDKCGEANGLKVRAGFIWFGGGSCAGALCAGALGSQYPEMMRRLLGAKEATSELPTFEWEPEKIDCTSNHLGASAPDHSKKMDTKKNTHSHTGLPYIS